MKIRFKKTHPDAKTPFYSKPGDAGLDLVAVSIKPFYENKNQMYIEYDTGIAVEIPEGYVGLIFPRSSISEKDLHLANSVGVIDSGYRGSIKLRFKLSTETNIISNYFIRNNYRNIEYYKIGDKIGQLIIIPYPKIEMQEVEKLSETERGEKGFGSTN